MKASPFSKEVHQVAFLPSLLPYSLFYVFFNEASFTFFFFYFDVGPFEPIEVESALCCEAGREPL